MWHRQVQVTNLEADVQRRIIAHDHETSQRTRVERELESAQRTAARDIDELQRRIDELSNENDEARKAVRNVEEMRNQMDWTESGRTRALRSLEATEAKMKAQVPAASLSCRVASLSCRVASQSCSVAVVSCRCRESCRVVSLRVLPCAVCGVRCVWRPPARASRA
jgi:hypothetical protein